MNNQKEVNRWMKDAKHSFEIATKSMELKWYRNVILHSQLVIEEATKAVIACFAQPEWTHSPDEQLLKIVDSQKDIITEKFGKKMINSLKKLAKITEEVAPWHAWSVYGRRDKKTGESIPAVDLCTEDVANWILELATFSINTAEEFINKWFQE